MQNLMVDFIISLDGYGAAEGWPGYWGLEGPEYLGWLEEQEEHTALMGATTYRVMSGFAADMPDEFAGLTAMPKVVFSSTLEEPLSWANTELVDEDSVEAVRHEAGRDPATTHPRQPHSVPSAAPRWPGRSLPGGGLPGDHRRHRPGPDLRRVPRCCARDG